MENHFYDDFFDKYINVFTALNSCARTNTFIILEWNFCKMKKGNMDCHLEHVTHIIKWESTFSISIKLFRKSALNTHTHSKSNRKILTCCHSCLCCSRNQVWHEGAINVSHIICAIKKKNRTILTSSLLYKSLLFVCVCCCVVCPPLPWYFGGKIPVQTHFDSLDGVIGRRARDREKHIYGWRRCEAKLRWWKIFRR